MISEESDYLVKSAVSQCKNTATVTTVSNPTSNTAQASQGITDMDNQNIAFDNNDNVPEISTIKAVTQNGGANTIYKIIFRNKTFSSNGKSELDAIKKILNNKIYKKDYLIEIYNNNNKSIYIVRANYKNKFKKIY